MSTSTQRWVCAGGSMAPTVQFGEIVQVRQEAPSRAGQAVVFSSGDAEHYTLHRFLFKVPMLPYFTHRGDALHAPIGMARWDRIVGTTEHSVRVPAWGDYVAGWMLVARWGAGWLSRKRRSRTDGRAHGKSG